MNRWALPLAVSLGLLIAWAASRPPSAQPASAPLTVFSAERAMADIRVIARAPHPVGSPENARVRDHLLARLTALGFSPEVRAGSVNGAKWAAPVGGGPVRVENVYGVRPGADRDAPALLLMAHYDSVPGSPGAADDAAGVAAILEAMRAFKVSGAAPARDIAVLFTDGEEAGLLGARAFFSDPAVARRYGAVLNFEARGGGGRALMFETSPGNVALIGIYRRSTASPAASSLTRFAYDRMPNGTDFTVPKDLGVPGLNFAFIGDEAAYHTPLATADRLEQGSLQHLGDQALSTLTALATAPALPSPGADTVYGDLFGLVLVAYPAAFGWVLLGSTAVLLAWSGWRARSEERFVRGLLGGVARLLLGAVLAGLLLHFARRMLSSPDDGLYTPELLAHPGWLLTGAGVIIAAAILTAWSGRASRTSAIGALLLALVAATALHAFAPEVAFILAWPVLLGAVLAALPSGALAGVAAVTLGALGLAWIAGLLHLLYLALGRLAPEALAAGALLIPLVLHPMLTRVQAAAALRGALLR